MNELNPAQFEQFFEALHNRKPFPWQSRLAEQVCSGAWPEVIDLPTASGKTSCLDIALFALAVTQQSPRRIFFVVDRRVIVDEAFQKMRQTACKLAAAKTGILASIAGSLRALAGKESPFPLTVHQLRGGIYRDQSWVRSPLQPMVITSTVDQIGSRLLFRGFGVSESSAPIHAGLIANDAVIFLDEAHCSRAFSQTLSAIQTYRGSDWAKTPLHKPFAFVEMTATPARKAAKPFQLEDTDHQNEFLKKRLFAPKRTNLVSVKGKASDTETLPLNLAQTALQLASETGSTRIAIMVNRVATARRVFDVLSTGKHSPARNVHLLIGRMRPIDRDKLVEQLAPLKAGAERDPQAIPTFVVSTQCLEVGADLDFDVLVTECASIDALLQRFGRLDRLGECAGSARGCILALSGIIDSKDPDPIYGESLAKTWRWMNQLSDSSQRVNMGVMSEESESLTVAEALKLLPEAEANELRRIGADAPALLPAHLDVLVQTSPIPCPDPEIPVFLHGREDGPPEVQVIWRRDLDGVPLGDWKKIVSLCPPVSAEAMPVRLSHFRRWLVGASLSSIKDSDLEAAGKDVGPNSHDETVQLQAALVWRGDESYPVRTDSDVKPNATVVLSFGQQGWNLFGHMPNPSDVAEEAIQKAKSQTFFRVNTNLLPPPAAEHWTGLIKSETFDWPTWHQLVAANPEFFQERGLGARSPKHFYPPLPYPMDQDQNSRGWVLQLKDTAPPAAECGIEVHLAQDEGSDEISTARNLVALDVHTRDVARTVQAFAENILPGFAETLTTAADFHDAGKADPRFQTMLHGGDHFAAAFYPVLLAKGEVMTNGFYKMAKQKSGLPDRFRHELVSLPFAAKCCSDRVDTDWILHLIASHHGYCRPYAPVVNHDRPSDVLWNGQAVSSSEITNNPPHHIGSGVSLRFWRFTREFGWWGSAYLEACLRLADWAASEKPSSTKESE